MVPDGIGVCVQGQGTVWYRVVSAGTACILSLMPMFFFADGLRGTGVYFSGHKGIQAIDAKGEGVYIEANGFEGMTALLASKGALTSKETEDSVRKVSTAAHSIAGTSGKALKDIAAKYSLLFNCHEFRIYQGKYFSRKMPRFVWKQKANTSTIILCYSLVMCARHWLI